ARRVPGRLRITSVEDMYAAVGAGDISAAQVLNAAQGIVGEQKPDILPFTPRRKPVSKEPRDAVHINGVGNLLTHMAGCCKPLPGDAIIGYITVGRGVSVHRQDCSKVLQLQYTEPERIIEVSWGDADQATFPVDISILAYDRQGLLRDITLLLATERANVLSMNTLS